MSPVAPERPPPRPPAEEPGDGYAVSPELVRLVVHALRDGLDDEVRALVGPLHAADLADLTEALAADQRETLVAVLGPALDPAVLAELDEPVRDGVIEQIAPEAL
ncbi:MAG: magnesium transporter, partial [Alphaproteobacteria bacterium]|nr:magnesium transporter [Alphaproteobacteria bacterium]